MAKTSPGLANPETSDKMTFFVLPLWAPLAAPGAIIGAPNEIRES